MAKIIHQNKYRAKKKNKTKNDFKKDFFDKQFQLWKNYRKCKKIKVIKTEKRRNYLLSEPNYYSTKFFTEICWQ